MTGNLRAKHRSRVATIEPGRVMAVEFDEAQQVKEGDVLVRIDDRRLREDLAQAEAQVAVARAAMVQQQAELQRAQADLEAREAAAEQTRGAVSDIELRQARTTAEVAAARLNAAEKELTAAETRLSRINVQLDDVVITAPFDGTVLSRTAEVGEYLTAGAVVGEIASNDVFEAVIEVPEGFDYAALDSADPSVVTVTVDTHGLELTPLSLRLVPDVDPRSRRFALVADVEASGTNRRLAAGMSVTASIPTQSHVSRLTVPYDALRRDGAGAFVFLVVPGQAGQSAVPVGVDVLFRNGSQAVIADNPQLREGAEIVVEGGERLRPGAPVQTGGSPAASDGSASRSEA